MSSQPPLDSTNEIRPLTSLRMVAALLVFLHHFYTLLIGLDHWVRGQNLWESLIIEGHIGVTLFFTLSGFLITLRYYGTLRNNRSHIIDYIRKRAARIYPLYFVLLVIQLFIANRAFMFTAETFPSWTLTQGFFIERKFSGIPTAWSLTVEECFYFVAPLVYLSMLRVSNGSLRSDLFRLIGVLALWMAGLFLLGAVIVQISVLIGIADYYGFMGDMPHMFLYTFFGRFFDFGVGIIAAFILRRSNILAFWQMQRGIRTAFALSIASIIGIIVATDHMNAAGGFYEGWFINLFIALCGALLILSLTCAANPVSKALNFSLFVYMGRISYALYLLQMTLLFMPIRTLLFTLPSALVIPASYVVLNLLSAFFYELVERPGRKLVLRLTDPLVVQRPAKGVEIASN